jgi:hypothetical protein
VRKQLNAEVNVPPAELVQFTSALGAAILGHRRLEQLAAAGEALPEDMAAVEAQAAHG